MMYIYIIVFSQLEIKKSIFERLSNPKSLKNYSIFQQNSLRFKIIYFLKVWPTTLSTAAILDDQNML